MKTNLIPLLLLICTPLSAQLFPTIEPHFPRPGIVYVHPSPRLLTPYLSVMAGPIRSDGASAITLKLSAGTCIRLRPEKGNKATARVIVGMNHTELWNVTGDAKYLRRWSCEAGIMVTRGRLSVIAITDPLLVQGRPYLESRFGICWKFGTWEKRVRQVKCPAFDVRQQKSTTRQKRLASK
jgi:hypothetical protein